MQLLETLHNPQNLLLTLGVIEGVFSLSADFPARHRSFSFTDGWKTAKVEMMEAQKSTKEDLLAQLLTGDRQATTDALLKVFDDEQVELDGDN